MHRELRREGAMESYTQRGTETASQSRWHLRRVLKEEEELIGRVKGWSGRAEAFQTKGTA